MRDYKRDRPWGLGLRPWSKAFSPTTKAQGLRLLLAIACALSSAAPAFADPTTITESQHYRIHSDLDPAVTRDYAKRLDAMYGEYARRLADFDIPPQPKFEVYLFQKQADYRNFTGNAMPNTAGMFIPSLHALAGYEQLHGRDGLRKTLQHEAFHQFAWSAISKSMPIWLDEGLAQIFEEGVWTGDRFILGQIPPGRLRDLRADMADGQFIPFRALLPMSRSLFQSRMRDPDAGRAEYNQSWAMTQFLVFATDDKGQPRYRRRLIDWLSDMHAGRDPQKAFADNFSPNIDGFEQRYKEWVNTLSPTPMAVYSDRVSKLAELIRLFQEQGMVFDSVDALRQYLAKGKFHMSEKRDGQYHTLDEDVLCYLCDIEGQPWSDNQLYFDRRKGPLPDIVLKAPQQSTIRARFYTAGKQIDHDLVFENP